MTNNTRVLSLIVFVTLAAVASAIPYGVAPGSFADPYRIARGFNPLPYYNPLGAGSSGGNTYSVDLDWYADGFLNTTYFAGQEVRVRVRTQFPVDSLFHKDHQSAMHTYHGYKSGVSHNIGVQLFGKNSTHPEGWLGAFNITGPSQVRLRVIPAHANRATSGAIIDCQNSALNTDPVAEFWGMSARNLAWGKELAFTALATFTVPPFPWKMCIKDVSARNATYGAKDAGENKGWKNFANGAVNKVQEPLYLWAGASEQVTGDYAHIKVLANGRTSTIDKRDFDSFDFSVSPSQTGGDFFKLVPGGFPCTYEKSTANSEVGPSNGNLWSHNGNKLQYCGTNQVTPSSGAFFADCVKEGSFAGGVWKTGTNSKNPYQTTLTEGTAVASGESLVAYGKLPAAGNYDICFSPKAYRTNVTLTKDFFPNLANARSIWFKLYKYSGGTGCSATSTLIPQGSSCVNRQTYITVASSPSTTLTWSQPDTTPLSWGAIKVSSTSAELTTTATTSGEASTTKEYYTSVGGDQLRLVLATADEAAPAATDGELYHFGASTQPSISIYTSDSATASRGRVVGTASAAMTSTGQYFKQYFLGTPAYGTVNSNRGCWDDRTNNAGTTDDLYTTTYTDLGGDPRGAWEPWNAGAASQSNAWAYARFPQTGRWMVCYRKAGTNNWRVVPRVAAEGGLKSFDPTYSTSSNFTYHLNDTRAASLGEFIVSDPHKTLDTQNSNYIGSTATAVGSWLKLVATTENCYTSAATAESMKAGLPECWAGKCLSSCSNCKGSGDDSTTKVNRISFHLPLPAYPSGSTFFRVCFKQGASNWRQLSDPHYVAHTKMTNAAKYNSVPATKIYYTLNDNREGTWGKFTFTLGAKTEYNPYLNSLPDNMQNEGDVVRLVINETSHGKPVYCDSQWGTSTDQVWDASRSSADLGVYCTSFDSTSTGKCLQSTLQPTETGGVANAMYPYTDVNSKNDASEMEIGNGTVAFITIPPALWNSRAIGYKVCYKQAHMNWVEAESTTSPTSYLAIAKKPTYAYAGSSDTLAGSYAYLTITGSSGATINPAYDIVKLVAFADKCDREAAGTQGYGNKYISFAADGSTGNSRGGARLVDGTSDTTAQASSQSASSTARAYMVLPNLAQATQAKTHYRVCYMTRTSTSDATKNWQDLGFLFNVESKGVTYSINQKPLSRGTVVLNFMADASAPSGFTPTSLNTMNGAGDAAKIVADSDACFASTTVVPNGKTSYHVGLEMSSLSTTLRTDGNVNLGPDDAELTAKSNFWLILPNTASTNYKVCYKLKGLNWMEVEQTPTTADRPYDLGTTHLRTVSSGLTSFSIASGAKANSPGATGQTTYGSTGTAFTSFVLGGISSVQGSTNLFTVTGTSLSSSDKWKLVRSGIERNGAFVDVPGTCLSDGDATGTFTPDTSSTTAGSVRLNFPQSGQFEFCYQKSGETTWVHVAATDANPFKVIPTQYEFSAATGTSTVTVTDNWRYNDVTQGSLLAADYVYVANKTDVCGATNDFQNNALSSVQAVLNDTFTSTVESSWYMATRKTGYTVPWLTTTALGTDYYKLCFYKTTEASTNASGVAPFMQAAWYQLPNGGDSTTGGGSNYLVSTVPTVVNVTCPSVFNVSVPIRTGKSIDVDAYTYDSNVKLVPFAVGTYAHLMTASVDATSSIANSRGACLQQNAATYGWPASNVNQFTFNGLSQFRITPLGPCPTGGCTLTVASEGMTSATCKYDVQATAVTRLAAVNPPTECKLGVPCTIRIAAFAADGLLAHVSVDNVNLNVTNSAPTGLTLTMTAGTTTSALAPSAAAPLANGFMTATYDFSVASASVFAADTTVTIAFSAGGGSTSVSVLVRRPKLTSVHIIDIYPDASVLSGAGDTFVRSDLVPTWEPSGATYWRGGLNTVNGVSAVTAAPGYHLVAQQFYTVVLRAVANVGGTNQYMADQSLLGPTTQSITISTTGLTGNAILGKTGCTGNLGEHCQTALSSTSFSTLKQKVTFRFKNAKGCQASAGGCTLTFKFGSPAADLGGVTSITSPVRSVATAITTECWADDGVSGYTLATAGTASCPSSSVEKGWILRMKAVDMWGDVDEYFNGNFLPVLKSGNGVNATNGVALTSVTALNSASSWPTLVKAQASAGVATYQLLTLSRPCAGGCYLQVLSDWGANIANVGELMAQPSTQKLKCTLASTIGKCTIDGSGACSAVEGLLAYDTTTADNNKASLLYKDTEVCVNVQAVNADGNPTLYETNWILYWAEATNPTTASLTVTDRSSQTDRKRYKPLVRSTQQFCFKVGGSFSSKVEFKVRFAAQQFKDANYWSIANGGCEVGTFTVWPKKHLGGVRVSKATGMDLIAGAGTAAATLAVQRQDASTDPDVTVDWTYVDHYNNELKSTDLSTSVSGLTLIVDKCTTDNYATSTCTGTLNSADQKLSISLPTGSANDRGMLTATVVTATGVIADGNAQYQMTLKKYCIGCSIGFTVKNVDGAYTTKTLVSAGAAADTSVTSSLSVNVIIQTDTTITRQIVFARGTSPLGGYWSQWTATAPSSQTGNEVFQVLSTCFTGTACSVTESKMLLGSCDQRTSSYRTIGASSTAGIALQVAIVQSGGAAAIEATTKKEALCANSDCTVETNILMQTDILTSYDIAISIGGQTLTCTGTACNSDGSSAPSQLVSALGDTLATAVLASSSFKSTSFRVKGNSASSYYTPVTSISTQPSRAGEFSASATTNTSGVTVTGYTSTGYQFVWRGPAQPKRFRVLDTAKSPDPCASTAPTYACVGGTCGSTGYEVKNSLETIAFNYGTTTIPVGLDFPMTVEVQDSTGVAVDTAAGTVAVSISSWQGCGNGGILSGSTSMTVANGRATGWFKFSAACQGCVLKFVFTPSSTQAAMYSAMATNPGEFTQFSKALDVKGAVTGTAPEVTSPLAADLSSSATVATVVTVAVRAIGGYGLLASTDAKAAVDVGLYNEVKTSSIDQWWYGNGGRLRTDKDRALGVNHATAGTFTGAGSVSFMFTRTCVSCYVTAVWKVNSASGSFRLRNSGSLTTVFTVTTSFSGVSIAGFRPRSVQAGSEFGVALWHTGSELSGEATNPIKVAGVASSGASNTASISVSATDSLNGDGGRTLSTAWSTGKAEAHKVAIQGTCDKCKVSFGADSFVINVRTIATHLRPYLGATTNFFSGLSGGVSSWFSFAIRAVDDQGYTDVWAGGYSACAFTMPFACNLSPKSTVSVKLSANGVSAGGFTPALETFQMVKADKTDGLMDGAQKSIVDGRGTVRVQFETPVRHGTALFFSGSLTSSSSASKTPFVQPIVDVTPGNTGLTLVANAANLDKMLVDSATWIEVGLVRPVDTSNLQFVSATADNEVTITTKDCPAMSSSATVKLVKGYARFPLTFSAVSDANKQCIVSLSTSSNAGIGSCTTCKVDLAQATVSAAVATKWNWIRPTATENGYSAAGPIFGAVGRKTYLTVGLRGPLPHDATQDVHVNSCDDPTTPAVETCSFSVSVDSACPTPTIDAAASFDANGYASLTVTWAEGTTASAYTCTLTASVTKSSTELTPPVSGVTNSATVTICKPAKIAFVTNATATYGGKFLMTGVPYTFYAVTLDADNKHCRGDSQDGATEYTVDAVTNARIPKASDAVMALNINLTETNTAAFTKSVTPATPAPSAAPGAMGGDDMKVTMAPKSTVRAIGGGFAFSLIFTNSTVALGLDGVRIRVQAKSSNPSVTNTIVSGPVDTMIAASMLRFHPMTSLPKYVVSGRNIIMQDTMASTKLVVQAVDPLMPWYPMANVARRASEPGNNAEVEWGYSPPLSGSFPLSFGVGARTSKLVNGENTYENLQWNGRDGKYALSVASPKLKSTTPVMVETQLPKSIAIAYRNEYMMMPTPPVACTSGDCILSNNTFNASFTDAATGVAFMSTYELRPFTVDVMINDAQNMPVMGDDESFVAVKVEVPADASVDLRLRNRDYSMTQFARVRKGRAQFNLTFTGTTMSPPNNQTNHARVKLSFYCPQNITLPNMSKPMTNPCYGLPAIMTREIRVLTLRAPPAVFKNASRSTVKVRANIGFNEFNVTAFGLAIAGAVNSFFPYINRETYTKVMPITSCEVEPIFGNGNLNSGDPVNALVCLDNKCVSPSNTNCPTGVVRCRCPQAPAITQVLSRYLLQQQQNNSQAIEVNFNLEGAHFNGTDLAKIDAEYAKLASAITLLFNSTNPLTAAFNLDPNSVSAVDPQATPEPTAAPPTPAPPTQEPANTTAPVPPTASASSTSVLLALLLGAILALLQ